MMLLCIISIAATLLVSSAAAQDFAWTTPGQVNTTMCAWYNPRAGIVRDTVYIDGGNLWWLPGLVNGKNGVPTADGNPLGIVYYLNFSRPWSTSSNFSDVLERIHKGPNDQVATTFGPEYYDGVMFASDNEWIGYGGLLVKSDSTPSVPLSTSVLAYEVYTDDTTKRFKPGFYLGDVADGMTRYVAYGGGVSIPVQNQGFYFGGLRAADFGPIYYPANETTSPNVLSETLISVDMTKEGGEKWTNTSLPDSIPGRASPELVWIPVANLGVLIAIGGVILPEYANVNMSDTPAQEFTSNSTSAGFMKTVAVYDIQNKIWYTQDTTGEIPPATAEGCTVVASALDKSSHNIYWYGGFSGLDATEAFYDDVYVLSVPSFTWTKIYTGTSTHGRAGHKCVKPYPDQMFVIGGYPSQPSNEFKCLEGGLVQNFNLSSAQWIDSYTPTLWSNYSIPSSVTKVIGGNGLGGATMTSPSKWNNDALASLFGQKYPSTPRDWFPYHLETPSPSNTSTPGTHSGGGGSSVPSWLPAVIGVVLGLVVLTVLIVIFLLWRRRRYLRNNPSESGTTDTNRYRIMSWVRGMPTHDPSSKAGTVTTDEQFNDAEAFEQNQHEVQHEVEGVQVHELMDTSRPQELVDTGFTYTNLSASPSGASRMTHASRIARSPGTPRPESPSLGNTSIPPSHRLSRSVVSSLSSKHKHQVSEVSSVDSTSTDQIAALRTPEMAQTYTFSPLTPPTSSNRREASDYVTNGGGNATQEPLLGKEIRRSNFEENLDDST